MDNLPAHRGAAARPRPPARTAPAAPYSPDFNPIENAFAKLKAEAAPSEAPEGLSPALEYGNDPGGFAEDGREYVVALTPGQTTPTLWISIVANPEFGFLVSADGAGCTWRRNSREHQLTPWSNHSVSETTGESIFLRDEESGEVWSATPAPRRDPAASYICRHGRGYSRFQHVSRGVDLDLVQFVPLVDPVKISRLRLTNRSGRSRRLSVTAYAEWALGPQRAAVAAFTSPVSTKPRARSSRATGGIPP